MSSAGATALDQFAQTLGQNKRSSAHFYDLDLASRDQQIQGATADAGVATGIGDPHADRLNR